MSTYNILNEDGILSTILDIAEEIRDTDVEEIFDKATRDSHKLSTTSLVRRTENLICTFPVMVSTSLSIDTAVMIMKAIERKAVVMIQLLFSSYNFTGDDATEILGQFHKNIKIGGKIGLDDFIDVLDRLEESGTLTTKPNTYDQVQAIKEGMRNLYRTYDDFINPTSINEMQISRDRISRDIIVEAFKKAIKVTYNSPNKKPGLLAVSGLNYTVNPDEGTLTEMNFIDKDGGEHEIDIEHPRKDKTYRVVTDEFLMSAGADYNVLAPEELYVEKYPFDKDVLISNYIKEKNEPVIINHTGRIRYESDDDD